MATIVLAHGAWSAAWAWKKMRPLLRDAGHDFFSPTYTGLGERAHLAHQEIDLTTHINDVAAVLDCEDLKDVTLLGHSYGGMVATGVADKARRRIARVVYIDAFAPQDGQSLFDLVGEKAAENMRGKAKGEGGGWRIPPNPMPPDTAPEDVTWATPRRRSQPIKTFEQKLRLTSREAPLPRAYIYAKRSGPGDTFRPFGERAKGEAGWKYYEMDASHNPHITCPQDLMGLLTKDHGRDMSTDVAYAVLGQLGRAKRADDTFSITGDDDPVFVTPWRVAGAGSAALGAVGLAVSDLWRLTTGRPQAVTIDRHAAAASLRSNTYVLQNGKKPVSWDPLAGHYPTRDGRTMFLHTNHPHHRAGALRIAGAAAETREALAEAVAKWDGLAIEEAIAAGGCVGGLVRSREEWNAHPHGIAVAKLPLIDIVKIGEAPPRPLPQGERPLSGVRALDLTRVLAGPTSGRVLAENGADVLHIAAPHLPYQSEILMDTGHGKRCAWVDLTKPAGVETMTSLLRDADIFTQGYRPGTVATRGFSPEQVAALRPGIVCVSICAYGHEGPWADRRGFDSIVQNVTGLTATQGSLAKPRNLPVQALDYIAGYLGALGAMVGLARRIERGGSWLVRVSLVQVAHWLASLGTVEASSGVPELPEPELARYFMESDGLFGHLRHLKPVVQLSETPSYFAKPPEPLGTSPARWA